MNKWIVKIVTRSFVFVAVVIISIFGFVYVMCGPTIQKALMG